MQLDYAETSQLTIAGCEEKIKIAPKLHGKLAID
jgi:hypothetical protein